MKPRKKLNVCSILSIRGGRGMKPRKKFNHRHRESPNCCDPIVNATVEKKFSI